MKSVFCFAILLSFFCNCQSIGKIDNSVFEAIRVNQVGFFPNSPKTAILEVPPPSTKFRLLDANSLQEVFSGEITGPYNSTFSEKKTWKADFSRFEKPGKYILAFEGLGVSNPIQISTSIYENLGKASLKAFYFQRASTELPEKYAGIWSRPSGHPDDQVLLHASAAGTGRTEGSLLSAPRGWYDAGDYNKYIVNSGITMATLLSLYEDFSERCMHLRLDIPESDNTLPDLLDEMHWNLQWMAAMQDPNDGGVYHKLTTARFEPMVLPHLTTETRFVVAKSTAATLDFAAVMAQASRVYKDFFPDLSIEYLKSAELAWKWALQNPAQAYNQNDLNKQFKPEIHTGAYGDNVLSDEWIWAASELYISTQNLDYLAHIPIPESFELPSWSKVSWLGYYSVLRKNADLPNLPESLLNAIKTILVQQAQAYADYASASPYFHAMGQSPKDFVWGSNAVAANQAIALIQAYRITNNLIFLETAHQNLDYLLGKNPTGYCYVTGFGYRSPLHPHHRLAEAEPEKAPLPGFLVGGPNPSQQDGCNYPSKIPDESYVDEACSYASNEIAINWNAPLAYLVNALQFLR